MVTSTPRSSFRCRSDCRSGVISRVSTPRYDPLPQSSLGNPTDSLAGSNEGLSAAQVASARTGRIIIVKVEFRMFVSPKNLVTGPPERDISGGRAHLEHGTAAVQISF